MNISSNVLMVVLAQTGLRYKPTNKDKPKNCYKIGVCITGT